MRIQYGFFYTSIVCNWDYYSTTSAIVELSPKRDGGIYRVTRAHATTAYAIHVCMRDGESRARFARIYCELVAATRRGAS